VDIIISVQCRLAGEVVTQQNRDSRRTGIDGRLDHAAIDQRLLAKLLALEPRQVRSFRHVLNEASDRLSLDYVRDSGERIFIPVNPMPAVPTRRQITYLASVLRAFTYGVARLVAQRVDNPKLVATLPLTESEMAWLRLGADAPGNPPTHVFHRWDCAMDLSHDPGAMHAKFFEVNSVDVGGIHYAAASRQVLLEALCQIGVAGLSIDRSMAGSDARHILLDEVKAHARTIGRKLKFLAIAENQDFTTGITEAASIARFFCDLGLHTECVDVRAFQVHRRKGVCFKERPVDLIYRNIELRDLAELEGQGADLKGMKAAARAGQLFSSPFGELDHKSLWEVLGSSELNGSLTPLEKKMVARHIPWTRLLVERRTDGPNRKRIDLPAYVRRHRSRLVLKPNRSCGGQGVTIGAVTTQSTWEKILDTALSEPNTWVTQELISIPRRHTVVLGPRGRFRAKTVYAVYGLFCSPFGVAFVGRASASPVVNVMQGGGMLGILGRVSG
jgi:diaminobutyrate-2-oxoglutarate transaminase